ncbi:hypothetical protein AB840_11170 [Megasphaera cerevisiae DSM 20462]|uniref:Uncharacterized protein n=2 Tax=Megasphaera TaxID=906 RepID=A0A0J6WR07_9FIRM|nr:hemagglutinin repeat-containing protein [Megasphaera cerevisiae]KMO85885.1 hypothetical protein AB840_11170 [Megasphaera cerevisiae DSM 20462]
MGIMIGTKKVKDTYDGEWKIQVGTTLASTGGNVTISAGDTAHLTTTDVVGQKGITVTAQDIILDGNRNEAREKQTHEESQSGLTISVSSPVVNALQSARSVIRTAQTRDNKTLQSLELFEGGKALGKDIKNIGKNGVGKPGIHVDLGSSSFKQEYGTDTNTYAGGSLSSSGTVTILAGSKDTAKGNIHATGETIQGKDVILAASNNIILDAGKNTQTETNNYSSKGASIGVTVGIGGINNRGSI